MKQRRMMNERNILMEEKEERSDKIDRKKNSITNYTLGALFWMYLGTGVQTILQLVVLAILARLVDPAHFGVVSAAMIVVNFSNDISRLGIGPAIVQFKELREEHIRVGFWFSVLLGILVAVIITILAPLLAGFFNMTELVPI